MTISRLREIGVAVSLFFSLAIFLLIAVTSRRILQAEKDSVLEDVRLSTGIFALRAGETLFPKADLFSLHFLVTTQMTDKVIKYAMVSDSSGQIRSHSDPEKIGAKDLTTEGEAARRSKIPLRQVFKGPDGLEYYYFSHPVKLGARRLGTVAVAVNSKTINTRLAAIKQKLLLVFLAALAAIVMLAQMRSLLNRERAASAFKSAMVRTVSHEFNNSLTVLSAGMFMLEETDSGKGDPSRRNLYRMLEAERKSLERYVKNILNEARVEAGRFKIEKKPMALNELVIKSVSSVEGLMRQKNISFSLEIPKEPVLVLADHEALSLVVTNLTGNAVKYTPKGGALSVRLVSGAEKEGQITFYAENSGAGISAEDIEKIKMEFFRTSDGKAAASGFGLGLKISSEMLALHGSSLEIQSEPGKSSRFYFSLPIIGSVKSPDKAA